MTDPDLPDMLEGILDDAALLRYLDEIETGARQLVIRIKGSATALSAATTLADLRRCLIDSKAFAAQLRYRDAAGEELMDTLIRGGGGTRIIRMTPPAG